MTEAEEAQHLARRKELWAAREAQKVEQLVPVSGGRGNKGFAAETAKVTGETKQSINRKIARAEKIEPGILEQVKGTELDKGVVLDQLAKTPREEQRTVDNRKSTATLSNE